MSFCLRRFAAESSQRVHDAGARPEAIAIVIADVQMIDELVYRTLDAVPAMHSLLNAASDAYMLLNHRILLLLPPSPATLHLFLGDYMQHGYHWPTPRCLSRL